MTRIAQTGWEIGFGLANGGLSAGPDGYAALGSPTIDTAVKRTGASCLKCVGSTQAGIALWQPSVGEHYGRVYFRKSANPSAAAITVFTGNGSIRINTDGTLRIYDSSAVAQGSWSALALANDTWYRIEWRQYQVGGTTTRLTVQVDGTQVADEQISASAVTASDSGFYGGDGGAIFYYDDFAANNTSGSVNNSWIGAGAVVLLKPVADQTVLGWTGGVGGTTNLWNAVDNTPPIGTATETDLTQIECAVSGSGNAYIALTGTYTAAGIGANDTIRAVQSYVCHGEDVATGTKTGGMGLNANPAGDGSVVTGKAFTFGNDLGALGTYTAGWYFIADSFVEFPTVTMGSGAQIIVRKTDTGTRVASVCFMGAYVEYAPAAGTSITPSVGTLALTGYAPTLGQTFSTSPAVAALTLTGYAPTATLPANAVTPSAGTLSLTGYAPTLRVSQSATPSVGTLTLTGLAPTVNVLYSAAPGAGTLTLTGYAPTANLKQAALPSVGVLTLTGYAPSVGQTFSISPSAGALSVVGYAPSVGQTFSIAPAAGALTLTGYAPTANVTQSVTAGVGTLSLTGYAPTVAVTQSASPGVGTLTLTGLAPTVNVKYSAAPGAGALTLTGFAPTANVTQAGSPSVGTLTLTGHAPSVGQTFSITPSAGTLTLTGLAPSVGQTFSITPSAGTLTVTGYAPTTAATQAVAPGVGTLTLTGFAPTANVKYSAAPSQGVLTLTGFAPTANVTQSVTPAAGALSVTGYAPTANVLYSALPSSGALSLTGYAPTVNQTFSAAPGAGTIVVTGYAPSVVSGGSVVAQPGVGALSLTGYAPTVDSPKVVTVGLGELSLTGYEPTVQNSGEPVASPMTGAGKPRRPRRRYKVEIDGEEFDVASPEEAVAVLQQAREVAEELASQVLERAAKAEKRAPHRIISDARKALVLPDIQAPQFDGPVKRLLKDIEDLYESTLKTVEIGILLRKADEDDEEEALLLLMA